MKRGDISLDNQTNNDQAKQLRQTVKDNRDGNRNSTKLPPRREVHKDKKKKTKFKIKYPVIRLLALLFVLIPIFILSYMYQNKDELIKTNAPKQSTENHDTIDFAENSKIELEEEEESRNSEEDSSNSGSTTEKDDIKTTSPPEDDSVESPSNSDSNTPSTKPSSSENQNESYTITYHKVKDDETLFSISIQYYKSRDGEQLIREWNNLDHAKIFEGQVLKIPIKDKTGK